MSKKTNNLLPVGARVTVQNTHTGHVAGYGVLFHEGFNETARGVGLGFVTRPCYLIRLDIVIDDGEGDSRLVVSVIVANPDNVKEA